MKYPDPDLLRPAKFVPETQSVTSLLEDFKKDRAHLAIVIDEYGMISGLITIEDILEEIVGDFTTNEADRIEEVMAQNDGSFLIDGTATIREINKATQWDLPLNGPKTMNGLVLEQLESIPDGNVSFTLNQFKFETVEINGTRVKKVAATCLKPITSEASI